MADLKLENSIILNGENKNESNKRKKVKIKYVEIRFKPTRPAGTLP